MKWRFLATYKRGSVRITLDDLPRSEFQEFLDYLRAELRRAGRMLSGTVSMDEDGTYRLATTIPLSLDTETRPVTWSLELSPDASVPTVQIELADSNEWERAWVRAASEPVERALEATIAKPRARFFKRLEYTYFGPALEGEYWLAGFRLAPALPNDEKPSVRHAERIVAIDQVVEAIDEVRAGRVAFERAERQAARLSLLVDRPIFRPLPEPQRWALVPAASRGAGSSDYRRVTLAFPPT